MESIVSSATFDPVHHTIAISPQEGINPANRTVHHVVAKGETLSEIATGYSLHVGTLLLANPQLHNSNNIDVGADLVIPLMDASSEDLAKIDSARTKQYASVAFADSPAGGSKSAKSVVAGSNRFSNPVPGRTGISQGFSIFHTGVDFTAPIGTSVFASRAGCVSRAVGGWNGGYGLVIELDHGGGMGTLYGHLSKVFVKPGQCVAAGDRIALSGNSGRSTGPHLHFEVKQSGRAINPLQYVSR